MGLVHAFCLVLLCLLLQGQHRLLLQPPHQDPSIHHLQGVQG
jgi:hypothetical protein